jgi:hypothetical protein
MTARAPRARALWYAPSTSVTSNATCP